MVRDQTQGANEDYRAATKAEALDIVNRHKNNVRFRIHVAVTALPVIGPHPRTFRACVPVSRAELVQFIEDAFHPYHEKEGYSMPIRIATGARPARWVAGKEVEYGTHRKFVYIG